MKKIFYIIIATIIISILSVYAAASYQASEIEYKGTTLDLVLDELYDASNSLENGLIGYYKIFEYTGNIQSITIDETGYYKLEVWGAQGGNGNNSSAIGGYGGYSVGVSRITKGTTLYIVVGGHPDDATNPSISYTGGYNGGGNSVNWKNNDCFTGAGGGATHIAKVSNLLQNLGDYKGTLVDNSYYVSDDILIVAGGGGGAMSHKSANAPIVGGSAGGYIGNNGVLNKWQDGAYGMGGSQTSGGASTASPNHSSSIPLGENGSFGKGGSTTSTANGGAGGGAGFFGGGAGVASDTAGGGSSYIASSNLVSAKGVTKHMYCYNCTQSNSTNTETYTISNGTSSCTNVKASADCAKIGDGYAKITFLGS